MFYDHYKGQSVGRILCFIYYYCGLHYAERVIVGNGIVKYADHELATYTWDGDVPTFNFTCKGDLFDRDALCKIWNENQKNKKDEVVLMTKERSV